MSSPIEGPLAALLTPRLRDGSLDEEALTRNVDFVLERGATGIVLCGGTGGYADLSADQRKAIFERADAARRDRGALIASNGAMRLDSAVELAEHAFRRGADAVLLPPPHFYRYEQDDLEAFYREAARRIPGPILLYNLPAFTTSIEPETAARLIESVDNIVGLKDSSGRLDALELLGERLPGRAARILGNDNALEPALARGLIDAVISGPAGVVPEITSALFRSAQPPPDGRFKRLMELFKEYVARIDAFPYPWGIQWTAEARGLFAADVPLPLSERRRAGLDEFRVWLKPWLETVSAELD